MAPVEIPRTSNRTLRVRFTANVSYGGIDYGPSYQAKEAEVREDWARWFVRNGKAVYVQPAAPLEDPEPAAEPEVKAEAEADPQPEAGADRLPDDLPGVEALRAAGVETWAQLADVEELTATRGIGVRTAALIRRAMEARASD